VTGSEDVGYASYQLPEPADVPPVAGMGKTPDDWVEAIGKPDSGGATAEDAAELAATMTEDAIHGEDGIHRSEEDAQHAAVVEAAVAAANEAVDAPLGDDAVKIMQLQPRRLTQERKERLDALGFIWSLRNKRIDDHWDEVRWLEGYECGQFRHLNLHIPVVIFLQYYRCSASWFITKMDTVIVLFRPAMRRT
jgi:hypothetical protein